jgi:ABC-type polysaccharide/polyol phosphate transport system ATPase subunit
MPLPATSNNGLTTVISLEEVGVRYHLPTGGTRSIKELTLLWLRRRAVFEDFWALQDISLHVSVGERLGIVGRNGAGKSTLLQVIARIVTPTVGSATVRGQVAPLLQLGAGFDTELTGRENVFLNGALLGMTRAQITEQFDAIIEFAELPEFVDVPLRAYSSGMAARLGFAVATAVQPEILLIDEVLSVGDEQFKEKCVARMREFSDHGTTVVLVTHDPALIAEQCTRAIWLDHGHLRAEGSPDEVVSRYHESLASRSPALTEVG